MEALGLPDASVVELKRNQGCVPLLTALCLLSLRTYSLGSRNKLEGTSASMSLDL